MTDQNLQAQHAKPETKGAPGYEAQEAAPEWQGEHRGVGGGSPGGGRPGDDYDNRHSPNYPR